MTTTENQILQTIVELEEAVRTMPGGDPKPDLLLLFRRLDELTTQLPPETDPTLMHYLHKKSYQKARLFLEGRDPENQHGSCGHV